MNRRYAIVTLLALLLGAGCLTDLPPAGLPRVSSEDPQDIEHLAAEDLAFIAAAVEMVPAPADDDPLGKARSGLAGRYAAVLDLKRRGCLGENKRGYLELRPSDYLDDPETKNVVQRLVAADNKDRKKLYMERARASGATVSAVEHTYVAARLQRGRPGEIFELPSKGEWFDAFQASEAGQRLGEACEPGEWVEIR